jgi:hypothetical protein
MTAASWLWHTLAGDPARKPGAARGAALARSMLRSSDMKSMLKVAYGTTVLALAGFGVACGMSSADSALGGRNNDPSSGGSGSDASAPPGALDPNAGAVPVDNAVILVHAAKSQAFRLCFRNELDRRPQPDSDVMPEANVVGVEVGRTIRLGPLRGKPGEVFLFDEPLIRAVYPQFGGAGQGPTCESLLSASNPLSKIAVSLGTIDKDLRTGVHLLVVRGCPGNGPLRTYSAAECGETWTAKDGNLGVTEIELRGAKPPMPGTLAAQVVNLSQPLESAKGPRDVVVTFGDLATANAPLVPVATNPKLFDTATLPPPTELRYAADDAAIYGSSGFRITLVDKTAGGAPSSVVLDQTLEQVQSISAPRELPSTYFAVASNYALLLLGDPAPKLLDGGPDTDDRRGLHFLAIPVIEPKADAGVDAGPTEPLDGGSGGGG